ncbi:MAG: M48 family metallopeptidase [Rhodospirillales bacterium]|nr:M48 family metallopeptidase [Alphaproteobacteria bacterium]MCB1840754.1 M48 family metallopeptidase [Alphaproteobacteria bacterium]MCB9976789.1 M48 family metallopeptidase [Rhodospirillales bacterium]
MAIERLVQVKRSKRARRVALRLDAKEGVMNLVVPPHMKIDSALKFAKIHEEWVRETLASLPPGVPFEDGTVLPILGQKRRISVIYDETLKSTNIQLLKTVLQVRTNLIDPSPRIRRFLKQLAKQTLTEMTERKVKRIGSQNVSVSVRETKSRWGSCSEDGNISYSWRLIFAPLVAIDYVVSHEVAHLIHLDHSDDFWRVCRRLSRDYFEGQYWMRNRGNILLRYGEE